MTAGFSTTTPGNWNELLRATAEDGLSPASLPAYLLTGADAEALTRLAAALSPSAHCVGAAANGMSFLAAPDALFVTVPLRAAGDREACLPSPRWLSTRPDAPLNGVIWLFSAADVWGGKGGVGGIGVGNVAAPYWKISLAACRRCGVDLPLYAIALGDDGIPGFGEFAASLQEEECRDGIVGWASAPAAAGGGWDDPAPGVEAMEACLRRWRDYRLSRTAFSATTPPGAGMEGNANGNANALFLLPWRAGRTVSRLTEMIADAAPSRSDAPGATLRGVYLATLPKSDAAVAESAPALATLVESAPGTATPETTDPAPEASPAHPAFARGVFRDRILPERWLASEPAERARRRSLWTKRFAVVTAFLLIIAVATRFGIEWGLKSMTDAPAAVLADVNAYRRWLRGGARGEAPVLAGIDPPLPVAFGSAPPTLPELPLLYREMIAPSLPILNAPSLPWRLLFRIGPREASDGAGLASWLDGPPVLALADEQTAAPLAEALARLSSRPGDRPEDALTPEEFNRRHAPEEQPVDWPAMEAGAFGTSGTEDGAAPPPVFLDGEEWRRDARSLGLWIRERQGLLSGGTEFDGLPDRFARKRFLDASRHVAALAEKIYRPWPANPGLAAYFTSNPDANADTLWRDMSTAGIRDEGGWKKEELSLVLDWLARPPAAATPDALVAGWQRAAEAWRDAPGSPLFTTAQTIWRRAAIAELVKWLSALPTEEGELRAATDAFAAPSAPLPRIPLCALSQASFDPLRTFRPEIWRSGMIARTVSALADAPRILSDLEAAGLLEPDAAAYLSRLYLEPARTALLSHARAYCDYWVADIAMLANPAHWIVGDGFDREAFWTDSPDVSDPGSDRAGRTEYSISSMNWTDFQRAAARVDPRDLTRRMLADLTQRRIEALAAMTGVMAALEGGDEGLRGRVEHALAAMAEDAKLFATPEYWQTAIAAWRAWRGLGNDAARALARMRRGIENPAPDKPGLMETFFPVLAANYYAPETGEPVRLEYWRGFVRTAVELLQAETRRERRLSQRNILLKADSFPWRRDASGGGTPATREEMRTLLSRIGFSRRAAAFASAGADPAANVLAEEQPRIELPDDSAIQSAVRELMGGLGLGADWLPPLNRALDARLLRLVSAFDDLEQWEEDGGVPLVVLPGGLQRDPRHRFLRAFSMRQERTGAGMNAGARMPPSGRSAPREWERAYEAAQSRWAWRIPEQEQMRLRIHGTAVFDFYNQTVPVPEARIGQARLADDVWPVLALLLGKETDARPGSGARVEGADDGARVWIARLPVRGMDAARPIWWEFGFALPTAFGPETPGGTTILDDWPTLSEWRDAVAEWNEFVDDDSALRIAASGEKWTLRNDRAASFARPPVRPAPPARTGLPELLNEYNDYAEYGEHENHASSEEYQKYPEYREYPEWPERQE